MCSSGLYIALALLMFAPNISSVIRGNLVQGYHVLLHTVLLKMSSNQKYEVSL
ncbi:hypothetical protein BDZ91DRAFT_714368 [Kalaharituber pfeilii]|nr:hypothetical protein BDZ91DRAFT_714368 [Kalaharituber pfeilii]